MLKLIIPSAEHYDEVLNEFIVTRETIIHLEHSLVSLSKWESRWCKPFLTKEEKTIPETIDYIKCMTITQNVNPEIYETINIPTNSHLLDMVKGYIESKQTATILSKDPKGGNKEIITAEVIYHWMISFNIPFECQKWHLNRLLTLIQVCNIKNSPPKKIGKRDLAQRNASLNAARRKGGRG